MGHPIKELPKDIRALEQEFAYLQASGALDGFCLHPDGEDDQWLDLDNAMGSDGEPIDLSDEVAYLDSRRLLLRHPEHPLWVQILDEGEPLAETTTPTGDPGEQPGLRIREVVTNDCTPVGLTLPGGPERVNKAMERFTDATAALANLAEELLDNYQAEIEAGIYEDLEGDEQKDALQAVRDFRAAIAARDEAQAEMLRAIAGRPAVNVSLAADREVV